MKTSSRFALLATALALTVLSSASEAQGDKQISVSAGFDYSSGDYGESEATQILFMPFSGQMEIGAWTYKLTVPFVQIEGPGALIGDEVIGTGVVTNESGMGDVTASISYLFYPETKGRPFVELAGKVKLPTADETKGLGTGEPDVTLQIDLFQKAGPQTTLFGGAGYRWRGDSDTFTLQDGWLANAGLSHKLSETLGVGLSFDFRQSASLSGDDPMEITPFVSFKPKGANWRASLYGTIGLTDGSADHGVGIGLKRRF